MISKYATYALNGLLGVLGCFLVATIVTAAIPEPSPEPAGLARAAAAPPAAKSWEERKIILDRNLFNASILAPAVVEDPDADLEATKLPLKLLGTVAGDSDRSWAAVLDSETGQHFVVRVGEVLKERAEVLRIERGRIVLQNGAKREELALEEDAGAAGVTRPVARATPTAGRGLARRGRQAGQAGEALNERIRRLSENRFSVSREDVEDAASNPANLFSQARIIPKWEAGQMVGMQVNAIQPGSDLEAAGFQNGDTVSEVNGVRIASPEDTTRLMGVITSAITEGGTITAVVTGADGQQRSVTYDFTE